MWSDIEHERDELRDRCERLLAADRESAQELLDAQDENKRLRAALLHLARHGEFRGDREYAGQILRGDGC